MEFPLGTVTLQGHRNGGMAGSEGIGLGMAKGSWMGHGPWLRNMLDFNLKCVLLITRLSRRIKGLVMHGDTVL